jgi:hypothetical protein
MKNVGWGTLVITLGVLLLMDRFGMLHVSIGDLWPLALFAIGIAHLGNGRIGAGVMFMLLGTAFFACTFHWYGMTYHNAWPLFMIAVGLGMVVKALVGGDRPWKEGRVNHE